MSFQDLAPRRRGWSSSCGRQVRKAWRVTLQDRMPSPREAANAKGCRVTSCVAFRPRQLCAAQGCVESHYVSMSAIVPGPPSVFDLHRLDRLARLQAEEAVDVVPGMDQHVLQGFDIGKRPRRRWIAAVRPRSGSRDEQRRSNRPVRGLDGLGRAGPGSFHWLRPLCRRSLPRRAVNSPYESAFCG
jgi:hypothetical protein